MSRSATLTDADVLAHVVSQDDTADSVGFAQNSSMLRFDDEAMSRMDELAARNRDGLLSPEESAELQTYLRIGNLLSWLNAKTRSTRV